jgi:hypothetical protein
MPPENSYAEQLQILERSAMGNIVHNLSRKIIVNLINYSTQFYCIYLIFE